MTRAAALGALALAAFVAALPAHAQPRVHFVLSDDGPAYVAAYEAARAALGAAATTTAGAVDEPAPDAAVLVALGTRADTALADDPRPRFATLVPAAAWTDGPGRSAIFLDQPLSRQLALVRAVLPPARTVGVVFGPASVAQRDALQAAADAHRLTVHAHLAGADEPVNGAVVKVLRNSEVLLALPDQTVFNRYTVRAILLASFRLRRPVIGFSESWVRAGAIAAVYSRPEQLGTELGQAIAGWLPQRGALPPSRAPAAYTLSVNREVAFSLGITLPADGVLLRRLQALEEAP